MDNDNKEQLLAAAIELFAESGYNKVSIREIADKAHANSAMISYYFGSKQKLYTAAFIKQTEAIQEFLTAETDKLDPREVLRRFAAVMLDIHRKSPTIMKFIARELVEPSDNIDILLKNIAPRLFTALSNAFTRGIEQKIFRPDLDIREAVILWIGMVNFFFLSYNLHSRIIGSEMEQENIYMKQTLEIFLAGIERRPSA